MLLALLFAFQVARTSPAAPVTDPLFRRYWDKLAQSKTLFIRDEFEIKTRFGIRKLTELYAFQRPYLDRMDSSELDGTLVSSEGDDGVHAWQFDGPRARLIALESYKSFLYHDQVIEGFLHPGDSEAEVSVARLGTLKIDGHKTVAFRVWHGKPTVGGRRPVVYLDAFSALPVLSRIDRPDTTYTTRYIEFKCDAPIDADLFRNHHESLNDNRPESGLLKIGDVVPTLVGVTTKEERFDLSRTLSDSKFTFVNVWGIGCEPCKVELPELQKIAAEYRERGLRVVTIEQGNGEKDVREVLRTLHVDLCTVYGQSTQPDANIALHATGSIPVSYLFDHTGRVVKRYADADIKRLRSDLETVLL